jgi:hypothetical protein
MAFNFAATFNPWALNGTFSIPEADLKVAFGHVFETGQDAEMKLLVKLWFFPELFVDDVERAAAILEVLTLLRDNTAPSAENLSGTLSAPQPK